MKRSIVKLLLVLAFTLQIGCRVNINNQLSKSSKSAEAIVTNDSTDPDTEAHPFLETVDVEATAESQKVYYIHPNVSRASYTVDEVLLSTLDSRSISGVTHSISGQILIDWEIPSNSRVSKIVVDLTLLESDSKLRDQRIRNAYLESNTYPIATFVADHNAVNFPEELVEGEKIAFSLPGNLTVRNITKPVVWDVLLEASENEINGSAIVEIQMSDFEVGPIRIPQLLETKNEMFLAIDFLATLSEESPLAQAQPDEVIQVDPIAGVPEYFADIEPILAANCVACHAKGQIGHSVYEMETAHDVIELAEDLAFIVSSGNMPPWPASTDNPSFKHERKLSPSEIKQIVDWANAGAPIDGDLETPLIVSQQPFKPLRSDIVMRLPEPYTPKTTSADENRCFIFDPQLTEDRFMTGYHVIPTNLKIAHHLISEVGLRQDVLAEVTRRENQDNEVGWACPGGTTGIFDGQMFTFSTLSLSTSPAWTPGTNPTHFPEGAGILLDKDTVFLIQMHYNTLDGTGPDQTELHLQLAPSGADLKQISGFDMYAPVEIPCPEGIDTVACTRKGAMQLGQSDPSFAQALLGMCGRTLEDYSAQPAENVYSDCLYEIQIDGEIVIAAPHMHELGKKFNITLNPDSPDSQTILDIDHWDFNWQGHYNLNTPIPVKVGDVVRVSCTWDNSPEIANNVQADPYENSRTRLRFQKLEAIGGVRTAFAHNDIDPNLYRYVSWGYGTNDEMCIGSLAFLPMPGQPASVPMIPLAATSKTGDVLIGAIVCLIVFLMLLISRHQEIKARPNKKADR